MAKDMGVPFLGHIPMDAKIAMAAETGASILDFGHGSPGHLAFEKLIAVCLAEIGGQENSGMKAPQ